MLENKLEEIKSWVEYHELKNTQISQVSIGWHLWHTTKVINQITYALSISDPKDYQQKFSLLRNIFLFLNWFPRGKGRSPKIVRPKEEPTESAILAELEQANKSLKELEKLPDRTFFEHPYFKQLNLKESKRFLSTHTEHHLKIIRDIKSKSS